MDGVNDANKHQHYQFLDGMTISDDFDIYDTQMPLLMERRDIHLVVNSWEGIVCFFFSYQSAARQAANAFNVICSHFNFNDCTITIHTNIPSPVGSTLFCLFFVSRTHIVLLCKWQRTCQYFTHALTLAPMHQGKRDIFCDISHTHTRREEKRETKKKKKKNKKKHEEINQCK